MKNIFDILAGIEVVIPEEKKADFETAFNENYKTIVEVDKLKTARDNYKSQLDTAQETLKGFEGVDVKDLQSKITALQNNITAKETEYQQKLADRDFNDKLNGLIAEAGGRNSKAIAALIDLETIKTSKNQDTDLQSAIEKCKAENDYLFGSTEPIQNPVAPTGTNNANSNPLAAVRAAMGLKAE